MKAFVPLALALALLAAPLAHAASDKSAAGVAADTRAAPTAGQLAAARELIAAAGMDSLMDAILDSMLEAHSAEFRGNSADARQAEAAIAAIREEFNARRAELYEIYAQLYARYFSEAELREMVAFYKSATGRRLVAVTPQMMKDMMPLAVEWGRQLAERVVERLRRNGADRERPSL